VAEELLPLFPLAVVLLPNTQLPLHIFEDRYKEMIGEAIAERTEFGVVLATGNGIVNAGCTAVVEQVLRNYPDGRMDIVTVGLRRFEIHSLNDDKSYLRGAVQYFDDVDIEAPRELKHRAVEAWRKSGIGQEQEEPETPDEEAPQLSFLLAHAIDDLAFRQQILVMRSEADRLRKLLDFFPTWRARRVYGERVKELAPRNGHARLPETE
jgi:Lon protease-like protein